MLLPPGYLGLLPLIIVILPLLMKQHIALLVHLPPVSMALLLEVSPVLIL